MSKIIYNKKYRKKFFNWTSLKLSNSALWKTVLFKIHGKPELKKNTNLVVTFGKKQTRNSRW